MFLIPFVELNYLGIVNYFGAIKGVMAVLAWFSNEILPRRWLEILLEMGNTPTLKG